MKRILSARRISDAPPFLGKGDASPLFSDSFMLPSQQLAPPLPSAPERELIRAVMESAIHALTLPSAAGKVTRTQGGGVRLNAIAWVMGYTYKPRLSFDYCCTVLGSDAEAARDAIVKRYGVSDLELRQARRPWVYEVFADSERRTA